MGEDCKSLSENKLEEYTEGDKDLQGFIAHQPCEDFS